MSDAFVEQGAWDQMQLLFFWSAVIVLLVVAVFPFFAMTSILSWAALVAIGILFYSLYTRKMTPKRLIACVFLPPLAAVLGKFLASILVSRSLMASLLGVVASLAFLLLWDRPLGFYYQWLCAAPRLKPDDAQRFWPTRFVWRSLSVRRAIADVISYVGSPSRCARAFPSLLLTCGFFVGTIVVVALVPKLSPTLAFFILLAGIPGWIAWWLFVSRAQAGGRVTWAELLVEARRLLGQYLFYGRFASGAPGVWLPSDSPVRRRRHLIIVVVLLGAVMAVGLHAFFPWSVGEMDQELGYVFDKHVVGDPSNLAFFKRLTPLADWESLQVQKPTESGAIVPFESTDEYRRAFSRLARNYASEYQASQELAKLKAEYIEREQPKEKDRRASFGTEHRARVIAIINDSPCAWIYLAMLAILAGDTGYLFIFLLAFAFSLTLPAAVLLAAYAPALIAVVKARKTLEREAAAAGTEWESYVARLESSTHTARDPLGNTVRERDHLFVGVEANAQFPVLLHRDILAEHAYICGQTGSGKTSLGIMPILKQLLNHSCVDGNWEPAPPVVVIDLKGDPALFNMLREASGGLIEKLIVREPRPPEAHAFRFFTPEPKRASHYFNPFASIKSEGRSLMQVCQLFMDALALNYGEGYGRSYYSRRSREELMDALEKNPGSIHELYKILKSKKDDARGDTLELVSTLHALNEYPMLSLKEPPPEGAHFIHMPTVLESRQIVYFWLPAAVESISVREIAKLALFSLVSAAIDRQREGKPLRQCYLVIDEFQRIAGENFKVILEQARSFGISAILANQTQSDLRTHDTDLRPTIRTNTRFKQFFTVSDTEEVQFLSDMSGQEMALHKSWTEGQSSAGSMTAASETETIKPRLTVNDILRVSDHPRDSIVHISRGAGYTQFGGFPFPVRSAWPMAQAQYIRLQNEPWPAMESLPKGSATMAVKSPTEIELETYRERARSMRALFEQQTDKVGTTTEAK